MAFLVYAVCGYLTLMCYYAASWFHQWCFWFWGQTFATADHLRHHHHHISVMELGHLLTRSGHTYLEVSSKVCHDSFCQLGNSVSLPWVIYYEAFYLHVVSSFSCIPVICLKLVLFLILLQFRYLFCNPSKENFNHWQFSRKEARQSLICL